MTDVAIADSAELERFLEAYPHTEYIDAIFVDVGGIIRRKRYPRAIVLSDYLGARYIEIYRELKQGEFRFVPRAHLPARVSVVPLGGDS